MSNVEFYDDESRRKWYSGTGSTSVEQLAVGCFQRIATATEAMAKNYVRMEADLAEAKRLRVYWQGEAERLERQRRALRGTITKLKKQARDTWLPT